MLFKRISLPISVLIFGCSLAACTTTALTTPPPPKEAQRSAKSAPPLPSTPPGATLRPTTFSALPGWASDDLRQVLPAFLTSCTTQMRKIDWKEPCTIAADLDGNNEKAIRAFFQSFFTPYQVINADGSDNGLVTGYYEPLLKGARQRGGPYQTPIYRTPDDLITVDLASIYPELRGLRLRGRLVGNKVVPYANRAELDKSGVLLGKEQLWVDDPIDAFFLQVQGSGRVQLNEGGIVRVAYADQNGYPYKSIGRYLVDKGELTLAQASGQGIKAWLAANPGRQKELLNANPSYVFFKEEVITDPSKGPKGAQGVPLTPQRSIAVDPQFVPLGIPVFLSTTQPNSSTPLQQLMVAQDTGGAIKGAVRADFFWGFGSDAGDKAGKMKQRGMMWLLLPKQAASI